MSFSVFCVDILCPHHVSEFGAFDASFSVFCATVSRIDKIIGLFCRIASLLYFSFAEETYNLIDPTNCSHPIFCVFDTSFSVFCVGILCPHHVSVFGAFVFLAIQGGEDS